MTQKITEKQKIDWRLIFAAVKRRRRKKRKPRAKRVSILSDEEKKQKMLARRRALWAEGRYAEAARAWQRKHPRKVRGGKPETNAAKSARYRADKLSHTPRWADKNKIKPLYESARRLTLETGVCHEVDHIVPLRNPNVCGLHVHWNLRVITKSENVKKRDKLLDEITLSLTSTSFPT